MKNFYIIKTTTLTGPTPDELTYGQTHWIDLQNGYAVVVGRFNDEAAEMRFSSHPDVQPLPHLLSGDSISADHQTKLSFKNFPNLKANAKTFDVANEIGKIHSSFRPTVF